MRVFIFTLGTRGDVQPYVALGQGLLEAGHEVTLCTDDRFRPLLAEHGVPAAAFNDLFSQLIDSRSGQEVMEHAGTAGALIRRLPQLLRLSARMQQALMEDGWRAAEEARPDLVVYHPKAFGGPHFAERLGRPAVMAVPLPMLVPTGEFPVLGFPRLPLGPRYHRATYAVLGRMMGLISGKYIARWRQAHGLPPRTGRRDWLLDGDGRRIPVLHAYSRHVGPVPSDWPPEAQATGFWFLDRAAGWQPDRALEAFLAAGPSPVYVGFGSMTGQRARERATLVVQALKLAGVRGILARGWGGLLAEQAPDHVHLIGEVPHDWLFPRMAAVVHHGGAGTTAAGLRAGRPSVICPFMADQPFWGRCVQERGCGPAPIPQRRLTAPRLAAAIREAVDNPTHRKRAAAVGAALRSEDGVGTAIARLEQVHRAFAH